MSFILNFLNYIGFINKFNFNIFIPDNLYNLQKLCNELYNNPEIL